MSVLIKGMDVPIDCLDCPYIAYVVREGNTYCRITGTVLARDFKVIDDGYKPEDCHIVPVPPHGRLIDADALIEWLYSDEPNALKAPFRLCTADRSDVIFLVKNAPTIIPASEEGETDDT